MNSMFFEKPKRFCPQVDSKKIQQTQFYVLCMWYNLLHFCTVNKNKRRR